MLRLLQCIVLFQLACMAASAQVATFAGAYSALITPESALSTADQTGCLTLNVMGTGTFTGKLTLGGTAKPYVVRGKFDADGSARFGSVGETTLSIERPGKTLIEIEFTLDPAAPNARPMHRAPYSAKLKPDASLIPVPTTLLNPATNKGKYTVILPAVAPDVQGLDAGAYPQGDGWALLQVQKNGMVSATGQLADGTPFSCSRPLSKLNEWAFYASIYRGEGSVSGVVHFRDTQGVIDADGTDLQWFKPANPTDRIYRDGWPDGITVDFLASAYVFFQGHNAFLFGNYLAPNASLTLSEGSVPTNYVHDVFIDASNRATAYDSTGTPLDASLLSFRINARTGVIAGSFTHPISLTKTTFKSVILQKQHTARGFFLAAIPTMTAFWESGAVTFEAQ